MYNRISIVNKQVVLDLYKRQHRWKPYNKHRTKFSETNSSFFIPWWWFRCLLIPPSTSTPRKYSHATRIHTWKKMSSVFKQRFGGSFLVPTAIRFLSWIMLQHNITSVSAALKVFQHRPSRLNVNLCTRLWKWCFITFGYILRNCACIARRTTQSLPYFLFSHNYISTTSTFVLVW